MLQKGQADVGHLLLHWWKHSLPRGTRAGCAPRAPSAVATRQPKYKGLRAWGADGG